MSRHIPADLADVLTMPTRILYQAEVLMHAGERRDRKAKMDAAHRAALRRHGHG